AYDETEIALAKSFVDQAVIAIENARLFNETKEALERQTTTAAILKVISESPTDVQPVFDAIVQNCMRLFGGMHVALNMARGDVIDRVAYSVAREVQDATADVFPMPLNETSIAGRAMVTGELVHLEDLSAADWIGDGPRSILRRVGHRSALCAPMLREGKAIGAIIVFRQTTGRFKDEQIALLETFADQAVIAIENVRLFNETKEALERQTGTAEVLKVISESPTDVQPVFDVISERAMRLCGAQYGFVFTFDGEWIQVAGACGLDPDGLQTMKQAFPMRPEAPAVVARTIREDAVINAPDVLTQTGYPIRETAERAGFRSALGVPMRREGRIVGAITVARASTGLFPDKQVKLLETFADQAVIAIQNARVFNETQQALERQTATAEVLKVISESPTDVQPVFDVISERAMRLCGAQYGFVFTFDGEWIHVGGACGLDPDGLQSLRQVFPMRPGGHAVAARTIHEGTVINSPDVLADPDYAIRDTAERAGFRSAVGVPMRREGRIVGSITVTRAQLGPFPDEQVKLLETFADQAVIAIENARLFNETKEALERQTASTEVLQVISGSMADAQPVFDTILRSCQRLFAGKEVGLNLVANDGRIHLGAYQGPRRQEFERIFPLSPGPGSGSGLAIAQARVVSYPDALNEADVPPSTREGCRIIGIGSVIFCPLLWEGRGIGVIFVGREPAGAFAAEEVSLLRTFADQAVIAIQNERLFNETQQALERQTATAEVLQTISNSVADTAPVFKRILDSCATLFGADQRAIFLAGDDGLLHAMAVVGDHLQAVAAAVPRPLDDTVSKVAIRERRVVHYPDTAAVPDAPPAVREMTERIGGYSALFAPMLWEGRGIGSIVLMRQPVKPFDADEIALLQTFADQAVIAIQNTRLFNETKEALEQQSASAEVLAAISNSIADTAPVFETILDRCERLFEGRLVQINLIGDDGLVYLAAYHGPNRDKIEPMFPMPLDESSATGVSILCREVLHFPDIDSDDRVPERARKGWDALGLKAAITAPMLWEGRGIGAVHVGRDHAGPFSEKEIALLRTFANQAVIAIQNARLFNETQEALEQQTATAGILKVISESPTDVQPVFDAIVESAHRLLSNAGAMLLMRRGDRFSVAARYFGPHAFGEPPGPEQVPIDPTANFPSRVFVGKKMLHIPDWSAIALPPYEQAIHERVGVRSSLMLPLLGDGECVGVLSIGRAAAQAFNAKEIALMQSFVDQAEIAIQNARLFNETREALEHQRTSAEVLNVISNSVADTAPVFDAIGKACQKLFSSDQVVISLVRDDGQVEHASMATSPGWSSETSERAWALLNRDFPRPLAQAYQSYPIRKRRVVHYPD
ncbi:MAG: GAF domain-containing protein, partial [Burkholderiales bacterium]